MVREEQIHAMVVFGDMSGFGSFVRRITYPDVEFRPFIRKFDRLIDEFEKKTGYFIKRLGDGFMAVVEFPSEDVGQKSAELIEHLWEFNIRIGYLIARKRSPRPEGFRFRMVSGYIWKTIRDHNRQDYLGYHVNLCEKILHVHRLMPFVCCENFKECFTDRQAKALGYQFTKLPDEQGPPDMTYRDDLRGLWLFTKRKPHGTV